MSVTWGIFTIFDARSAYRDALPVFCPNMSETRQYGEIAAESAPNPTVDAADRHPGGHRIARHHHLTHQIVYASSGLVEVTTQAGTWVAPPDRAIWIPALAWHEHRFYGNTEFNCVSIEPSARPFADDAPVVVAVTGLVRELIVEGSRTSDPTCPAQQRLRLVLLDQLRRTDETALSLRTPSDDRLVHACAIVTADLTRNHSLADLGRTVGASERTLSRLLRDELELTYPQWRTSVRLHRALILLAEGAGVTEVAHRCGWATPSAFIDAYRRVLGHTPGSRRAPARV